MRAVIFGAGEVGSHIARVLTLENIEVVVVDKDDKKLQWISSEIDVATVEGEAGSNTVFIDSGIEEADFLIAATDSDEKNMITCLLAKGYPNIKRKIARIRNPEYFNNKALLGPDNLDIHPAINPEYEAAMAIVRLMEIPLATDVEAFEGGAIKVIGLKIPRNSAVVGKRLMDLKIKLLVGAIIRDETVYIPNGASVIRGGDIIYLPVRSDNVSEVISAVGEKPRPARSVMIAGGGRIGFNVAKALDRKKNVTVKIIEKDKERCLFLDRNLNKAIIFQGEASDQDLMVQENISNMDVFAAVTNNEEVNIMSSILAMRLGAHKSVSLVNRADYIPLANNLGIEAVLSPRLITASTILRYIRKGEILSLTTIANGKAEVIEARVGKKSSITGKPLKYLKFPDKSLVGTIIRDNELIIPTGNDSIEENDRLIIFTLKESIRRIEELLQ
jgi:trk system potassium uptake protein TrkA